MLASVFCFTLPPSGEPTTENHLGYCEKPLLTSLVTPRDQRSRAGRALRPRGQDLLALTISLPCTDLFSSTVYVALSSSHNNIMYLYFAHHAPAEFSLDDFARSDGGSPLPLTHTTHSLSHA